MNVMSLWKNQITRCPTRNLGNSASLKELFEHLRRLCNKKGSSLDAKKLLAAYQHGNFIIRYMRTSMWPIRSLLIKLLVQHAGSLAILAQNCLHVNKNVHNQITTHWIACTLADLKDYFTAHGTTISKWANRINHMRFPASLNNSQYFCQASIIARHG